jgi:nucleotide-binding universal stress UspA family protein
MARFTKILCPIDFNADSQKALSLAADVAGRNPGARLILQHVVMPLLTAPDAPVSFAMTEEEAKSRLDDYARPRLGDAAVCQTVIRTGEPAPTIIRTANELEADLIVMATHGRTGLKHFFLGSVAERVVREADIPVLTYRPH